MKKLSPDDLRNRLRFDFQVCQRMFGSIFTGEAYRNTRDLDTRNNPIISLENADQARKYRVDFYVKTLIGKDQFTQLTTIGVDLSSGNYPFEEPPAWVISKPIPYSPHFKKGKGICTGSLWASANGKMLLGEFLVHIARILNWDSTTDWTHSTNTIYEGWNPEAAKYYFNRFGKEPITKNLRYPLIPLDLIHGTKATPLGETRNQSSFSHKDTSGQVAESRKLLFRPHKPVTDNVATPKLFRRRED